MKELKQLTVDYAKQETLDPLKGVLRFVALGTIGSFALGIGLVLWIVAGLRALQTETGSTFTGHLTWAPYAITLLVSIVIIALSANAIKADKRRSEKKKAERAATATGEPA